MFLFSLFTLYLGGAAALVLPSPIARNSDRIIGGDETTIEDRPFSAALGYHVRIQLWYLCGASILSEKYLLSSAMCKIDFPYNLFARVGSAAYATGGQVVEVQKFTTHPDYDRETLQFNVAILTLGKSIILGPTVVPVVLPTSPDPEEDEIVTISGWGVISTSSSSYSNVLHKVDLPVWDHEKCKKLYSFVTDMDICLGGTPLGGTGSCFGDFGGPATYNGVQIAVISATPVCSGVNLPGVYSRILPVLDWIKEEAKLN